MISLEDFESDIPQRLLNSSGEDQLILVKRIVIKRGEWVLVGLTSDYQLLEMKDRSILTRLNLSGELILNSKAKIEKSIFATLSPTNPDELSGTSAPDKSVILSVFRSNNGLNRKFFYLLRIDHRLLIVERRDQPSVQLSHYKSYSNYIKHIIDESDDRPGYPVVKIYLTSEVDPIVTDFQCYHVNSTVAGGSSLNNFTCFNDVLRTLKDQTNTARCELNKLRLIKGEQYAKLNERLKQVPSLLRTENPDEKRPLVQYGDLWMRINNEQLIIGAPVFNCTYKRRLTLTNLKFLVSCPTADRLDYSYKFYRLKDDDYNFRNLDQILEAEDSVPEVPLFNQEWTTSNINALHSEETAIFVASFALDTLDLLQSVFEFQCFVMYQVGDSEVRQNKSDGIQPLQLYLGTKEFKRSDLYDQKLLPTFQNTRELHQDLLTLTVTSEFLPLEITFDKIPDRGLDHFYHEKFGFRYVNFGAAGEEHHHILYNIDNGYWQGTLIRLDEPNGLKQKIKLYGRHGHQMLAFLQAIYSDFGVKCSIVIATNQPSTLSQLKDCLKAELDAKINNPTDLEGILQRELETDNAYLNISEK
ncbi:uncharacterized protein LOC129750522 [Uranotaenia lowii]|uniref:uncharacterized protein LOC129750522 n=1 Tax=Uranotaenia lowii TaxID=190385 RepID=UPI00247B2369|nr:uncharacterized protein LOC129750522 [Uranotaenia lowii]